MKALSYLLIIKLKGTIRNIFSKKSSAIITVIALLSFGGLLYLMLNNRESMQILMPIESIQGYLTMYCGYAMFFLSVLVFQKRTAMVTTNDANYIFAGPFDRKQILGYLLVDTVKGTFVYAFGLATYSLIMMASIPIRIEFILLLYLGSFLMFYFTFALITFFYFWEMENKNARKIKLGVTSVLLVFLIVLFGLGLIQSNYDFKMAIGNFAASPLFNFVPIFGWIKYGLISGAQFDLGGILVGFGATFFASVILTVLILNIRSDFYEQAIQDAEWVTELRRQIKSNKNNGNFNNTKIKEIKNVSFLHGAGALFSKNVLIMKKTGNWLEKKDIILVLLYLGISYFIGNGFDFYKFFILVVVMAGITADTFMSEMKIPYIYLIPDSPLRKLLSLVLPIIFKMTLLLIVALLPCLVVFQASLIQVLLAFIQNMSYVLIFVASGIWSIRLLKSGTSMITETYIKMLIMFICMLPSIVVILILELAFHQGFVWAAWISMIINLLIGGLLIYACRSMLNGINIMSD